MREQCCAGPIPTRRNIISTRMPFPFFRRASAGAQDLCVLYVEDVGGILTLEYDGEGNLEFRVESDERDYLFDEIGSGLKIKQIRTEKADLLESLELFYKTFYLERGK